MRKIIFRGKLSHSKEWIEGNLIIANNGQPYIIPSNIFEPDGHHLIIDSDNPFWVDAETVSQFTGLLAKNRKKNLEPEIYEDDIFRHTKETDNGDIAAYLVVMWIEQLAAFYLIPIEHYDVIKGNDVSKEKEFSWLFEDAELRDFSIDVGLMKVGNIHDTPELLTPK